MLDLITTEDTISKIAMLMPIALVKSYGKKTFYTAEEVAATFENTLNGNDNIKYAYAMFCSLPHFIKHRKKLAIDESYNSLRLAVSKGCFGRWPRFNFDYLLDYSKRSTVTDVGINLDCGE